MNDVGAAGFRLRAHAERGVVHGCEDGFRYSENPVTRDQMSVYVARAFGLPM